MESRLHQMVRPGGLLFIETGDSDSLTPPVLGGRWHWRVDAANAQCPVLDTVPNPVPVEREVKVS